MGEHTKGPWHVEKQDDSIWSKDYTQVAHCKSEPGEGMLWDKPERAANAHLIAAAPELLEALEEATPILREWADVIGDGVSEDVSKWEAAIAKAEGTAQ